MIYDYGKCRGGISSVRPDDLLSLTFQNLLTKAPNLDPVTIDEVKTYFSTVIDQVASVFVSVEKEMCGLEWSRLYENHHQNPHDANLLVSRLKELYGDLYVKNRRGIYECLLDGE